MSMDLAALGSTAQHWRGAEDKALAGEEDVVGKGNGGITRAWENCDKSSVELAASVRQQCHCDLA
jgi:hypothetical protein